MSAKRFALLARIFLFLFTFALEVRVKASELLAETQATIQEEPAGCWKKAESTCAVKTRGSETATLELGSFSLKLDHRTVVARLSGSQLRLISGQLWVRGEGDLKVHTEFGFFELTQKSDAWFARSAKEVTASNAQGSLRLFARGSNESLDVPEGMENWLGRVGEDGRARVGVPVPMVLRDHLQRWGRLFVGSKEDFESEAKSFYARWTEAAQANAEIHQKLFSRKVAAMQSAAEKAAQEKQRRAAADKELLDLFRRRTLDEP